MCFCTQEHWESKVLWLTADDKEKSSKSPPVVARRDGNMLLVSPENEELPDAAGYLSGQGPQVNVWWRVHVQTSHSLWLKSLQGSWTGLTVMKDFAINYTYVSETKQMTNNENSVMYVITSANKSLCFFFNCLFFKLSLTRLWTGTRFIYCSCPRPHDD